MWVDPGRDGWRIFEGGTGSAFPKPLCEDNDDDAELCVQLWEVVVEHFSVFFKHECARARVCMTHIIDFHTNGKCQVDYPCVRVDSRYVHDACRVQD